MKEGSYNAIREGVVLFVTAALAVFFVWLQSILAPWHDPARAAEGSIELSAMKSKKKQDDYLFRLKVKHANGIDYFDWSSLDVRIDDEEITGLLLDFWRRETGRRRMPVRCDLNTPERQSCTLMQPMTISSRPALVRAELRDIRGNAYGTELVIEK